MSSFFTILNVFGNYFFNIQQQEEMAGSDIYVVLSVTLIIWFGIFFYLMYLDRKVNNLKTKIETDI